MCCVYVCICAYVPPPVPCSTHLVLEEGRVITNGCVDQTHHLMIEVQWMVTTGGGRVGGGWGGMEGE